jgi:hypothetical protein
MQVIETDWIVVMLLMQHHAVRCRSRLFVGRAEDAKTTRADVSPWSAIGALNASIFTRTHSETSAYYQVIAKAPRRACVARLEGAMNPSFSGSSPNRTFLGHHRVGQE